MCEAAEVKVVYLPPYSQGLKSLLKNSSLKKIKKQQSAFAVNPGLDFGAFLEWCANIGERERGTRS